MSSAERFRASALRIARHHGAVDVTLTRGSISLFETISGNPATLVCGNAAQGATSLPLSSVERIHGRLSPGVKVKIAGHALTYTVQTLVEPVDTPAPGYEIEPEISPGLEFLVSGQAVALTPKSLSFVGGQIEMKERDLPAGWSVSTGDEIWAIVPPDTDLGHAPREGDIMTAPIAARISKIGGREGVEYVVLVSPLASKEVAA